MIYTVDANNLIVFLQRRYVSCGAAVPRVIDTQTSVMHGKLVSTMSVADYSITH